jgi:hypothetical protein
MASSQGEAMARPAPYPPQGDNDYGNDDETPDERIGAATGKRSSPTPASRPVRQSQTQRQGDVRQDREPVDIPWQDLEPPSMDEEAAAAPREEARARAERKSRAEEAKRDPLPASAPVPEPVIPEPRLEDPTWGPAEETKPEELAESAASPKPPEAGKRRKFDIAGTIYLILLALIAASLSAAVVLFVF